MSRKRIELGSDELKGISGGMLDAYVPVGSSTGVLTSTKTGKTYFFDAKYLDEINEIICSSGYEIDKIDAMSKYFI